MNSTKIEWCDYTWNPVTGCYHGCAYCYARRIAERFRPRDQESLDAYELINANKLIGNNSSGKEAFPIGFLPTFHPKRLDDPKKLKKPARIFTVSMGDLFGEWVPNYWIDMVLKTVRECPQHTFIFLTKNPQRYRYFNFPRNCWVGTSITGLEKEPVILPTDAKVKFVSIEPLLGDIRWYPGNLDWIIIGAQTGPGAVRPKPEWVRDIMYYAINYRFVSKRIPVFLKDSIGNAFDLNPVWPHKVQDFPEV